MSFIFYYLFFVLIYLFYCSVNKNLFKYLKQELELINK